MNAYFKELFYYSLLVIAVFASVVALIAGFNLAYPQEAEAAGMAIWLFIENVLDVAQGVKR